MWINFNLFICLLEGRGIKRPVEDDYTYAAAEKKAKLVEDMKVPPSSFCRSCKWEEVVPVIFNHRPHDADIPITLYHQVFAHFQEYCTNIHISMDDCDLVIKLITQMTKAFERENDRVAEFLKWTSEYFAHPVTKLPLPQIGQEADIGACHSNKLNQKS
ncbi:6897_t:CDS:2 [Entrophospora sp. SA101]|nr:6897_t:CDS:2 [Entrophospora sp. SA101]